MIKLNDFVITPTIFPDNTSQIWKIPSHVFDDQYNVITWVFESEAELLYVTQLADLVWSTVEHFPALNLPYLPYARQDKNVDNEQTFAFRTFSKLLNAVNFTEVRVYDPHNIDLTKELIKHVIIEMPDFTPLLVELGAAPVYPDAGAAKRYRANPRFIIGEKDRDQLTGKINGITLCRPVEPRTYLIVDDICDGGRTFIELAKLLYAGGATDVHLYVSHGIFSRGLEPLREAGIKRIFTRNGEVK